MCIATLVVVCTKDTNQKTLTTGADEKENDLAKPAPDSNVNTHEAVIVVGGYKTASTTLQHSLQCAKVHDLPSQNSSIGEAEIVVVTFRPNELIYPSALFQDILRSDIPYSPFHRDHFLNQYADLPAEERQRIINELDPSMLVTHFNKIAWDKYLHLNTHQRIQRINKYFGVLIDVNADSLQIFRKTNTRPKIVALNAVHLDRLYPLLVDAVYGAGQRGVYPLVQHNVGTEKWYSTAYLGFLEELKV